MYDKMLFICRDREKNVLRDVKRANLIFFLSLSLAQCVKVREIHIKWITSLSH